MRKKLSLIVIIICVAVIAVSGFMLIRYYVLGARAEKSFDELRPPETSDASFEILLPYYQKLKARNSDFIGWLKIRETDVDYPVMQSIGDPERYLHKDFDGKYSASGTLFASELSDVHGPSDVVLIYGHNMKNGSMFAHIKDLLDQEYLNTHNEIVFDTLLNRNEYKIVTVFHTDVNTGKESEFKYYNARDFANEEEFNQFISNIQQRRATGTDIVPVYGDKLLLLSTCEDAYANGRIVVLAVRTSPERGERG